MTVDLYDGQDPRDIAAYALPEAAEYLRLARSTLRAWLLGQPYPTAAGRHRSASLFKPASSNPLALSFWNLVEAQVVSAVRRRHEIPMQKLRRALSFVEKELGVRRPLIHQEFQTDGVDLFVEYFNDLLMASAGGQTMIREVLRATLKRIERDEGGLALRLYPWKNTPEEPRAVLCDPHRAFGRPVVTGTSIPVEVVVGRFTAGDTIAEIARDYRVDPGMMEAAVRWGVHSSAA